MFKKSFKVSKSHALSNKDRKKMIEQMINKQGYSEEAVAIIQDGDLFIDKLVGVKAVVYSKDGIPMLFAPDGKKQNSMIFPSLYFMFNEMYQNYVPEEGILRVYVTFNVEKFLFRGADLMWPGIFACSRTNFKQNELVEVYARFESA